MNREDVQGRMRRDWDERARLDARFFVAFGRREQTREEFLATAREVLFAIEEEFRRFGPGADLKKLTVLEIGCGPGRLMLPLSERFGRVIGFDVSGGMVELARENLAGVLNAEARRNSGSDFPEVDNESIDFCYSYAVFQHIPDKEVVWNYLRETVRVLKVGGFLKLQFNGLPSESGVIEGPLPVTGWSRRSGSLRVRPASAKSPDTWSGVRFRAEELAGFAEQAGLQLLALDRFDTQYLWMTARKREAGWQSRPVSPEPARIVRVTDTFTADAVVARSGRYASASVWVMGLSDEADLNRLRVVIDGQPTAPCFIGKDVPKNPTQVNVYLPPEVRTGVVAVRLTMDGRAISADAPLRVIPAGPLVPRLLSVTDSVNLLSEASIESRAIKVKMEEVPCESEDEVAAAVDVLLDDMRLTEVTVHCLDPLSRTFGLDLKVPDGVAPGAHRLMLKLGRKTFVDQMVQVAS
jgi:SAM-dependent methyltransferase